MILEKVKKAIQERRASGSPLAEDDEVLKRIESGYFEETKDVVIVNLENDIKNAKGEVLLEKLQIKKKILGRDMLKIDRNDTFSIVALLLGVDKKILKFIPAFLTEIVFTYFGEGFVMKDRSKSIKEKDGYYVYQLEEAVRFEDETLKELKVLMSAEMNTEHLSFMMMNEGTGLFQVMSQIFGVKMDLLENMVFTDLDAASKIIDRLKKKRW